MATKDTPRSLGYHMPAEWERHESTWIAWPHNQNDWPGKFEAIPWVYAEIVRHLSHGERKRRISQTFGVGFFLSIACCVVGLVLYLGLQSVLRVHQAAGIVALTVSVLPLALMQMTFWPGVMASMWRTRFSSRKVI